MMGGVLLTTIPHGRTARRVEWVHLPPAVRRRVEQHAGSPVVAAESAGGGFTPGFASVLTCADGSRHFVKAAGVRAQRAFATAYREEARVLAALPGDLPVPHLRWAEEVDGWFAMGLEHVDAALPARPWSSDDLRRCSDLLVALAARLTPAPSLGVPTLMGELAGWPGLWDRIDRPRADELGALAARAPQVLVGETLVHTDVRDDNLLLAADGRTWLCDWKGPLVGPAWLDSLWLLVGPRGDGLDVEAHLAAHPLLAGVDPDDVDTALALLLGYLCVAADQPVPSSSPHLRRDQAWQRDVLAAWVAERRGWS